MIFTPSDIIAIAALAIVLLAILLFRGRLSEVSFGNNKIKLAGKNPYPGLDPDAARLYTREIVRLTNLVGDLDRRVMLSEMMRHGEEGLTVFCNVVRSDFREFLYSKQLDVDKIDDYSHENEMVVNQLQREMHGWILLAMRQNSIPIEDHLLEKYVSNKFHVWDGETDEIRRKVGRTKSIHQEFLVYCRGNDKSYVDAIFSMFKKAALAEASIKEQIERALTERKEIEDHFAMTAQVKAMGC